MDDSPKDPKIAGLLLLYNKNGREKMKNFLIVLALVFTASCATIFSDKSYPVSVNSVPSEATFTVSNRAGQEVQSGTTPQVVTLKASSGYFKRETYTIVLSKDGFEDNVYTISSSVDGWYWGNILFGGLIGMLIVDPLTGAMYKLPDRIDASLSNSSTATYSQDIDILFATIDSLSEGQKSRLEVIR